MKFILLIKDVRVLIFLLGSLIVNLIVLIKIGDASRILNLILSMCGYIAVECIFLIGITLQLTKHILLFNCWKSMLEFLWKFLLFVFFIFAFTSLYFEQKTFVLLPLMINYIFIMYLVWLYCCGESPVKKDVKVVSVFGQVKNYYKLLAVNGVVVVGCSLLSVYILSNNYCSRNILLIIFAGIMISLLLYNFIDISRIRKKAERDN